MKSIYADLFHALEFVHDPLHGLADVVAGNNCVCGNNSIVALGGHDLCARDEKIHDPSIQSVQVFEVRLSIRGIIEVELPQVEVSKESSLEVRESCLFRFTAV